jgi:hypothetical protein
MIKAVKPKHQFKAFQIMTQSVEDLNKLIVELIKASNDICQENGEFTKFKLSISGKSILYNFEVVNISDWIVLEQDGLAIYSNEDFQELYSC